MLIKQDFERLDVWHDQKMEKFARDFLVPAFDQTATKEWCLENLASKEWCLENLATKEELKALEKRLDEKLDQKWSEYFLEMKSWMTGELNYFNNKFYKLVEILENKSVIDKKDVRAIAQA